MYEEGWYNLNKQKYFRYWGLYFSLCENIRIWGNSKWSRRWNPTSVLLLTMVSLQYFYVILVICDPQLMGLSYFQRQSQFSLIYSICWNMQNTNMINRLYFRGTGPQHGRHMPPLAEGAILFCITYSIMWAIFIGSKF